MSITKYCNDRKERWNTPDTLRNVLVEGNFIECKIPLDTDFKHAYDLAIDLVGYEHFMVWTRTSIWFEDNTVAIQFRLSL